jgi:hypothetical protein
MANLESIAFFLAAQGYAKEVDTLVGVSKTLAWDKQLWQVQGPQSRRLMGAVKSGNETRIEFLLDHGAKPNEDDLRKATREDNLELVERLIEAEVVAPPDTLLQAVENNNPEMLEELIKTATSLNGRDKNDMTALMRAVELRQIESVKILLAAGANPNVFKRGAPFFSFPYSVETLTNPHIWVTTALDCAAGLVDKTSVRIYWLIKNAGGLHGRDLQQHAEAGMIQMG